MEIRKILLTIVIACCSSGLFAVVTPEGVINAQKAQIKTLREKLRIVKAQIKTLREELRIVTESKNMAIQISKEAIQKESDCLGQLKTWKELGASEVVKKKLKEGAEKLKRKEAAKNRVILMIQDVIKEKKQCLKQLEAYKNTKMNLLNRISKQQDYLEKLKKQMQQDKMTTKRLKFFHNLFKTWHPKDYERGRKAYVKEIENK